MIATRIAASSEISAAQWAFSFRPAEQDEQRRERDHRDQRADGTANRRPGPAPACTRRLSSCGNSLARSPYPGVENGTPRGSRELRGGRSPPRRARPRTLTLRRSRPFVMFDTHDLRACSSLVRTPLMTSVTVVFVGAVAELLLDRLAQLGRLHGRLELRASARLTVMRTSRSALEHRADLGARAVARPGARPWRPGPRRPRLPRPSGPAQPTPPTAPARRAWRPSGTAPR